MITGPTMSGKSTFIKNMVKYRKELFTTQFNRIIYSIPPEAHHRKKNFYEELKKLYPEIELVFGLPKEDSVLDNELPKLLLIGKNADIKNEFLLFTVAVFCKWTKVLFYLLLTIQSLLSI